MAEHTLHRLIHEKTPRAGQSWTWVQPRTREELLTRLADARDLDVPARERENLCAAAYTEILGMPQTAAEQQWARAEHDIIVREAVVTHLEQQLAARDAEIVRMHNERQELMCVGCGQVYPPDTCASGSDVLTAHITVCEKHPMRATEALLAARDQEIRDLRSTLTRWPARIQAWIENDRQGYDVAITLLSDLHDQLVATLAAAAPADQEKPDAEV